jgi:hypothetical protein
VTAWSTATWKRIARAVSREMDRVAEGGDITESDVAWDLAKVGFNEGYAEGYAAGIQRARQVLAGMSLKDVASKSEVEYK